MTIDDQKRRIAEYVARNQPVSYKEITHSVEPTRATVKKRIDRMDEIICELQLDSSNDEPSKLWRIDPEKARDSDYLTDEAVEEVVKEENHLIEELKKRNLLEEPKIDSRVNDFLREARKITDGYKITDKELRTDSEDAVSLEAFYLFMEIHRHCTRNLDDIEISGKIELKPVGDDRYIDDEVMRYESPELRELLKELPEPENSRN